MPSPSDSSSVASASGSRGWSDSRRGMSGRGPGGARLLLYLGLCHLGLGAMVLAFSFTSMAFTSSARVRQSCPFWAGFFVVASGIVGIISWRRPLTLVQVSLFMLLSAVCVILSLAGSMLSCQNAQMFVQDLLFSACGLSILSTIICTLSTVTCSIHIFSLDLVHLLAPHRSRSVNPECTTPQDAFLTNIMDFEEFVPPIPPPPYYPPEYTCSSETDAQSITYNGSMESPVPLYPTDCPPPYETVMGQRAASQATVFDAHGTELSGERGTSTAFSGESMDSGSLLMSEIVDIPDDSSPSEDSCLMEVGIRSHGGNRTCADRGDSFFRSPQCQTPESPLAGGPRARRFLRGERSNSCSSPSTATNTYRSPVLHRQAVLASSCSQLEAIGNSPNQQQRFIPEIQVNLTDPSNQEAAPASSVPPPSSSSAACEHGNRLLPPHGALYLRRRAERSDKHGGTVGRQSEGFLRLVRSHSEPGLGSSTDTSEACLLPRSSVAPPSALPSKGGIKTAATSVQIPPKPAPTSPICIPKDCHRSLGDLKVTRVLVARFLQRSKRNLGPPSEHAGSTGQGPKRRSGVETVGSNHLSSEQHSHHPHRRGHHHSHSDSRHNRHYSSRAPEGIHLRSCGDLSSSTSSLRRLMAPHAPHGSSGALYSESAL
uniref:Family with sequence similarity 189 member B n=1 Tax=Poecilia latipinna TaxID=48699 RepID=A0A3B3TP14_9TELE